MPDRKYGAEVVDLGGGRVEIGRVTRSDGTIEPIYAGGYASDMGRRLLDTALRDQPRDRDGNCDR
jgi:hypothetical protein